ncbi:MAG: hypothetical protein GYB21_19580 [Oceanospirillales bacterium]|nr:hypothetical protein [Oceanospirillales bacterium]
MHSAQKICLSLAMILAPTFAMAEPIATIKKLSGDVSIVRNNETLAAALGDRIHQKDSISTGNQGSIGILFDDDTRIAVGPNSKLSLADYSYNARNHRGGLDLSVSEGTVSVIAGKVAQGNPEALSVATPASAITVSGNAFSIKVDNPTKEGNAQ